MYFKHKYTLLINPDTPLVKILLYGTHTVHIEYIYHRHNIFHETHHTRFDSATNYETTKPTDESISLQNTHTRLQRNNKHTQKHSKLFLNDCTLNVCAYHTPLVKIILIRMIKLMILPWFR